MSYNGSGTFQINTSGQPVVAGTVISATAFNALTADLATGLSTAITKDGQTTTTARIPFAAGISSTLTTDSSSVSTGSIIAAGGVGIAKALYVGTNANVAGTLAVTGVATFSAAPIYSSLTASSAVATDASKGLVSVTNTGTGNNVLATSPTLVTPILGAASATSVTVAAGAVGTPSITTTGDTNTGIFFPAADTIAFSEGGVEAMRIADTGNVGIGTSSPGRLLSLSAASPILRMTETGANSDLDFIVSTNSGGLNISVDANNEGASSFCAVSVDGSERMRIDSSGNLLVGTTSSVAKLHVLANAAVVDPVTVSNSDSGSGSQFAIVFRRNTSTVVGSIQTTNVATSYVTSSDYRLKENIAPMTGALAKVSALKPVTYTWKDGGSNGQGFIAHELQAVCPDAVTGKKDGEQMQGVDYGKLTPILTAALQEAIAKIKTLEARIAVLEAK
jgi:hypothetical protein